MSSKTFQTTLWNLNDFMRCFDDENNILSTVGFKFCFSSTLNEWSWIFSCWFLYQLGLGIITCLNSSVRHTPTRQSGNFGLKKIYLIKFSSYLSSSMQRVLPADPPWCMEIARVSALPKPNVFKCFKLFIFCGWIECLWLSLLTSYLIH